MFTIILLLLLEHNLLPQFIKTKLINKLRQIIVQTKKEHNFNDKEFGTYVRFSINIQDYTISLVIYKSDDSKYIQLVRMFTIYKWNYDLNELNKTILTEFKTVYKRRN